MPYVIFSIDFENNPYRMNLFMNFLASIPRSEMTGAEFKPMIGSYNGVLEHSFICNAADFDQHLRDTDWIKGQESILHVASGNKMETSLEYLADGRREPLGCMQQVTAREAARSASWSYRPDMDVYWVAAKGNPDHAITNVRGVEEIVDEYIESRVFGTMAAE